MTVDFLIPATSESDRGGALRNFEDGFAAIITPGLELAFQDRRLVTLHGATVRDEQAIREVWVCEAGAFTILKTVDSVGPLRFAEFLGNQQDDTIRADAAGTVRSLLALCRMA